MKRRSFLQYAGGAGITGGLTATESAVARAVSSNTTENWPSFQFNSENQGYNPNVSGPADAAEAQWKFSTLGKITSTPIVVDDTVYVGSRDGKLYAVDVETGDERWRFETGDDIRYSPVYGDGHLYVGNDSGSLFKLNTAGLELWKYELEGALQAHLKYRDEKLYAVDPDGLTVLSEDRNKVWGIDDNNLNTATIGEIRTYIPSEPSWPYIYAYNSESGDQAWRDSASRIPSPVALYDNSLFYISRDGWFYSLDISDGSTRWVYEHDSKFGYSYIPVINERSVFFVARDKYASGTSVYRFDSVSGEEDWEQTLDSRIYTPPVLDKENLYVGAGVDSITALDRTNGEVKWVYNTGGQVNSAPAIYDGTLLVGSDDGYLYRLKEKPPNEPPSAAFEYEPDQPLIDTSVSFDASDASDSDGSIEQYRWDFTGDGVDNATGAQVSHTYEEPGEYPVRLTVVDDEGATDSDTVSVSVYSEPPEAVFEATLTDPAPDETVSFDASDSSAPDSYIAEYRWDFTGDGETDATGRRMTYAFESSGDHEVTLTVENGDGATATATRVISVNAPPDASFAFEPTRPTVGREVTFNADGSSDPDGWSSGYDWDFDGDGTVDATGTEVTHTFDTPGEHVVTLTVVDNDGKSTTSSRTVDVQSRPPEASFEASPGGPAPNEVISFDARSSSSPDGDITSYRWTFGDEAGAEATGARVTHAFETSGEHEVTLTVEDEFNETATTTRVISVNEPPEASFTFDPARPDVGQDTTFEVERSNDPDGRIGGYDWDFDGDGTVDATGKEVTHAYDEPGEYDVALTVVDDDGKSATVEQSIETQGGESTASETGDTRTRSESPSEESADGDSDRGIMETATNATDVLDERGSLSGVAALFAGGTALTGAWLFRRRNDSEREKTTEPIVSSDGTDGSNDSSGQSATTPSESASSSDNGRQRRPTGVDSSSTASKGSLTGQTVGDFVLGELIGTGGNADVYRAITVGNTTETAAIKIPRAHTNQTIHTSLVDQFVREAETWSKLDDHENVVTVLEWDAEPFPWIAMEYMDGGTLIDRSPLAPASASTILQDIAAAIEHAHRHGVTHGDLKPSNVLFDEHESVQVGDWGLARVLLEHSESTAGLSPAYAAPEQFGEENLDAHGHQLVDIYQLGAVGYELFTGRPPFEGSPYEIMDQIRSEQPTPPTAIDSSIPDAVNDVLLTALATDPADRYENVTDFRRHLEDSF